jgi:hypothetical protein
VRARQNGCRRSAHGCAQSVRDVRPGTQGECGRVGGRCAAVTHP